MIELHAHTLGYTDDPSLKPVAVAHRLRSRKILTSWLGAPTVTIKPVNSLARLRGQCAYLFKAPVKFSPPMKDGYEKSGHRCVRALIDRPSLALRLAEVLCDIDFFSRSVLHRFGGEGLEARSAAAIAGLASTKPHCS